MSTLTKLLLSVPPIYIMIFFILNFILVIPISYNTYLFMWIIGFISTWSQLLYLFLKLRKKHVSKELKLQIIIFSLFFYPYTLYYIWVQEDKI